MGRNRELQKLVDKADEQRRGDEQRERENNRKQIDQARKSKRKRKQASARTVGRFMQMTKRGPGFLWWLLLTLVVLGAVFVRADWYVLYVGGVGVGLFAIRLAVYLAFIAVGFPKFRRFPDGIPFQLDGATELLDSPNYADVEMWQQTASVSVELKPEADTAVVEALLDLYVRRANGWQYLPDDRSDPRTEWKRTGQSITGSINVWVAGELYELVQKLAWVHRKTNDIARVKITRRGEVHNVSRPSVD